MDFRIADTFTDSLARLTGDEQKAAKTKTLATGCAASGHSRPHSGRCKPSLCCRCCRAGQCKSPALCQRACF